MKVYFDGGEIFPNEEIARKELIERLKEAKYDRFFYDGDAVSDIKEEIIHHKYGVVEHVFYFYLNHDPAQRIDAYYFEAEEGAKEKIQMDNKALWENIAEQFPEICNNPTISKNCLYAMIVRAYNLGYQDKLRGI